jgi:hypothetical protein
MAMYIPVTGGRSNLLTPGHIFTKLGNPKFDTDVAGPAPGCLSHVPARRTIWRDSLLSSWKSFGFVWMNAPYNSEEELKPKRNGLMEWLDKFTEHGSGIALTPDRTSSPWFQRYAPCIDLILLWAPKIKFLLPPDGAPLNSPPHGNAFWAMGDRGCAALEHAAKQGHGLLVRPVALRQPANVKILEVAS